MLIRISNLIKIYNKNVVLQIENISISANEKIGIVGKNGSGKTTFLRLLLDLIPPDSGFVEVESENVVNSDIWKENVSAYLDNTFLIEFLTVKRYLKFLNIDYLDHILVMKKFDLEELIDSEIRALSSGQKKKVGIVAALLRKTKIKIFDEPSSFLDSKSVLSLIDFINNDSETTYIFADHNKDFIEKCSSRVLEFEKGKIIWIIIDFVTGESISKVIPIV